MSSGRLANQTAWISGGTKGIGEGTARLFAQEGAAVAVIGRNEQDGRRVAEGISRAGGRSLFYRCDVTRAEEVHASIEAAVQAFGKLDILVNNAGIVDVKALHEYTEDEYDRVMAVNVKSMFLAFKYAFPHLRRQARSYVVNVGSISSFVGQDGTPVYTASKGAVLQLSRSIGLDYARYGIRCNCVCPGITDTPMLRQHLDASPDPEGHLAERLRRVPLGTILTPEDIARSILFFSCEDSAGITATSLVIDGGYLAAAEWDGALHAGDR
ncbi:MAG: SDR family NAD(P)-dependent oxidoreductase [Candidatus Latescibacterota bacterium]|jgi:NAD(P)-dependent dehydrogenase (short-subunit alcohol dehydrogenase family)